MTTDEQEFEGAFKSAGITVSGELMVPLPPPGEHLWVLPVWYRVDTSQMGDDDDDEEMGTLTITFNSDTMVQAGYVGCIVCKMAYEYGRDKPCPGPQDWEE